MVIAKASKLKTLNMCGIGPVLTNAGTLLTASVDKFSVYIGIRIPISLRVIPVFNKILRQNVRCYPSLYACSTLLAPWALCCCGQNISCSCYGATNSGGTIRCPPSCSLCGNSSELPLVFDLSLPRYIDVICHQDIQLLGFADASIKGYATVMYLRFVNAAGDISVQFITCKTKVALLKCAADESLSIPRLELCGSLLLAQTLHHVQSVLSTEVYLSLLHAWSDSSAVLSWLTSDPKHFKIFVTNRVAKIRQLLPGCVWNYVSTNDNPADPASRGLTPKLMLSSSIYWNGPEFIRLPEDQWPSLKFTPLATSQLPEIRPNVVTTLAINVHPSSLDFIGRFSSLEKMLHEYCLTCPVICLIVYDDDRSVSVPSCLPNENALCQSSYSVHNNIFFRI
ncbi:hypothetical protein QTP88_029744 [Uroleucon formosanum]